MFYTLIKIGLEENVIVCITKSTQPCVAETLNLRELLHGSLSDRMLSHQRLRIGFFSMTYHPTNYWVHIDIVN